MHTAPSVFLKDLQVLLPKATAGLLRFLVKRKEVAAVRFLCLFDAIQIAKICDETKTHHYFPKIGVC